MASPQERPMRSHQERHNRGLPDTPPRHTPEPRTEGAPKWMWLIPIVASLLGFIWVGFKVLTADEEIRGLVALVSVNAAMAESILAYLFVRSVDHLWR